MANTSLESSNLPGDDKGKTVQQCSNLFSEFFSSAYRSGVQRPAESICQLAGPAKPRHVEVDDHQHGLMKLANIAGVAAGELLDIAVLGAVCKGAAGKLIKHFSGPAAPTVMAEHATAINMTCSGLAGLMHGSLFTPLSDGQGFRQRLDNGLVSAGTFAAMDGVSVQARERLGAGMFGRISTHALSGAAGGLVNTNLESLTQGHGLASARQDADSAAGWAIGNLIAGETLHGLSKGADFLSTHTGYRARPAEEISTGTEGDKAARSGKRVPPRMDIVSMRELAEQGKLNELDARLVEYYPRLQEAFPLEGEIETPETYKEYLTDKHSNWEMEHLLGKVIGGLQYQVLDVKAPALDRVGWLEHIWVKGEERSCGYGYGLFQHVQARVEAKGGDLTTLEFNNPEKMTPEEIAEDARGGISTQDRQDYWGKNNVYVLEDDEGNIAPYSQPSMDGQPPVKYLSLGFVSLKPLDGKKVPTLSYLKLLHTMHTTIPNVDLKTDPTVQEYTSEILAARGKEYTYRPLIDRARRIAAQLGRDTWRPDGY